MKRAFLLLPFLLLAGCPQAEPENPAVPFAKNTWWALVEGDAAVAKSIDWDNLVVTTKGKPKNVGKLLAKIPDEAARARFKTGFLSGGMKAGESIDHDHWTDWRVKSDDSAITVVSATAPNEELEFGISKKNSEMKLTSITSVRKP